jgi:ATP-dependent DNA helicase RecQ
MDELERRAEDLLRLLTGNAAAAFHAGQLEAIRALAQDRRRVLVVQRTGWGKSAVYFIATRLLRDDQAGPTLLVSPLLALMRNQIEAARRMGVRAATINSSNTDEWSDVIRRTENNEIDLLLISPERLANRSFRETVLDRLGQTAGLVVVDEAHCISDWGHDFRPDYRRIRRVLDLLPRTVPVLACTATANDRVVGDIVAQLGDGLTVVRGPLGREGLSLHVIDLAAPSARMAWLAQTIPQLKGAGIIYCLTKRDVELVTEWLRSHGITAVSYTGESEGRVEAEQALLGNEVDVVVATSALGMGFDKPDLAFVIHFQAPGSVITYYQQVGRAGRQLETSLGVLLRGGEDTDIQDWFIISALPTATESAEVLAALEAREGFVKLAELEAAVNVKPSRIQMLLKNLEVDGVVVADGQKWQRTPRPFAFDAERVERITALRRTEQEEMRHYGTLTAGCRMAFLRAALDELEPAPCGICDLCTRRSLAGDPDVVLAAEAAQFLRQRPIVIEPRKQWPASGRIPPGERVEEGRALCRWGDGGWGSLVRTGKQRDGRFDDHLVDALARLVGAWDPQPRPRWVTWVPSLTNPDVVSDLARRVAGRLGLPAIDAIAKVRPTGPQKLMQNSAQQLANINGSFAVAGVRTDPVLLVDDIIDSRWTVTHVGALLRQAGCSAVLPIALAWSGQ